jgi:hypothetical protein
MSSNPPFVGRGIQSQAFDDEWAEYLRRREEMLREVQGRVGLTKALADSFPSVSEQGRFGLADAIFTGQRIREFEQPGKYGEAHGLRQREYLDLVGRASRYAGNQAIDELKTKAPEDLMRIIMRGREQGRELREETPYDWTHEAARGAGAVLSGSAAATARIMQSIPFIGDALAKRKAVQDFDIWASQFDEAIMTDQMEGTEAFALGSARVAGNLLGYMAPGALAWRAAGPVTGGLHGMRYLNRIGPIGKVAMQGSIATAMLEGGGDAPWEERLAIIAAGGAFSAGAHVLIPRFMGMINRLEDSFGRWWDPKTGTALDFYGGGRPDYSAGFAYRFDPPEGPIAGGTVRGQPVPDAPTRPMKSLPPFIEPAAPGGAGATPMVRPLGPGPGPRSPVTPGQTLGRPLGRDVTEFVQAANEIIAAPPIPGIHRPYTPPSNQAAGSEFTKFDFDTERGVLKARILDESGIPAEITAALQLDESGRLAATIDIWPEMHGPDPVIGAGRMRNVAREMIERLRGMGEDVQVIKGERITGAKAEAADAAGEFPPVVEIEADKLLRGRRNAESLNKTVAIAESPASAAMSVQGDYDDADVAIAGLASNPGGIAVVRNVGDAAQTVAKLTRQSEGRLMPHQIRVVERSVTPATKSGFTRLWRTEPRGAVFDPESANTGVPFDGPTVPGRWFQTQEGAEQGLVVGRESGYDEQLRFVDVPNADVDKYLAGDQEWFVPSSVAATSRIAGSARQVDILVSEGLPITNKRVDQYKKYGFFEGQHVVTQEGMEMVAKAIDQNGLVTIESPFSGQQYKMLASDITPGRTTSTGLEIAEPKIPHVYEKFRQWASDNMADEARRAGIAQLDWMSMEASTQLPRLVDEFLDKSGVTHPVTRAVYSNYFNTRRVQEYANLAPQDEAAQLKAIRNDAAIEVSMALGDGRLVTSLEEIAESKGFKLLEADTPGHFTVEDMVTGWNTVMAEAEANEFLRTVRRDLPGVMEPLSAPEELIEAVPGTSHPGTSVDPVQTTDASIDAQAAGGRMLHDELGENIDIDDILSMATFEPGKVGAKMDPSLLRKLGANMYKGDPSKVIVKEALQNAIDAVRNTPDGRIIVKINSADRSFKFIDNGSGMSPKVMADEFMDPGGSFKEEGASGGYGLAKVGLFGNAEKIVAISIHGPPGNRTETTVSGSGEDWMTGNMNYETRKAMPDEGTGTSLYLKIHDDLDMDIHQATSFLDKFRTYNRTNSTVDITVDGQPLEPDSWAPKYTFPDQPTTVFKVKGADIEITNSAESRVGTATSMSVLNNGLYQFDDHHYFGVRTDYPQRLIINIKPTVDTEHNDYPFTTSREEFKSAANEAIKKYLDSMELGANQKDYTDLVEALMGGTLIKNTYWRVYPSSKNVPAEFATELAGREYMGHLLDPMEQATDAITLRGQARWGATGLPAPNFGGVGLSQSYLGVNISFKGLKKIYSELEKQAQTLNIQMMDEASLPDDNMILMNPFNIITDMLMGQSDSSGKLLGPSGAVGAAIDAVLEPGGVLTPEITRAAAEVLAEDTWATLVHEVSHQSARGHDENFSGVITRLEGLVVREAPPHLEALTQGWVTAIEGGIFSDWSRIGDIWRNSKEVDNVFKKISGHHGIGESGVSSSSDGQGRSGVAPAGSTRTGFEEDPNAEFLSRSRASFLGSGASGSGAGGSGGGTTGRGGGGLSGSTLPPFIRPVGLLPGGSREPASMFRRRGPLAQQAINDLVTDTGFRMFNMMFHAMRKLDMGIQDVLGAPVGLADDYTRVSTGYTKMRNDAAPWMHEAEAILTPFGRRRIRDGSLMKIMEIGDTNATIDAMTEQSFSPTERQAVWDLREFLDRFFQYMVNDPAYKVSDSNYVFGYISRVRNRQMTGMGDEAYTDKDEILPRHLKFFAEEARTGKLDFREQHVGNILGRLIRGAMFHKHVRPAWEHMAEKWDQPEIPEQARAFIGGFLKFVHQGRDPKEDALLVGMRHMLNKLGMPITDGDMASMTGGMVGNMYRAYLGLRPDVMLREFMQPGMAGSKIGHSVVWNLGYKPYLTGGQEKVNMIRLAIEKGWVEPGVPRGLYAGAFEEMVPTMSSTGGAAQPFYAQGAEPSRVQQQQKMADRREAWNQFIDAIYDRLPDRAKQGISDTGLDPLYFYGKTTSAGKVIVGNAAYSNAMQQIGRYQRGEINLDQLHATIGSAYYGRPMQHSFDQLLHQGDIDGAASRYANDVVADAMLKTGGHEQPAGLREMNAVGRMALMFGTFSIGTLGWLSGGMKAGPAGAAKFATRYGMLIAAAAAAEAASGFKFSRWLYHDALLFAGSPVAQGVLNTVQAWRGTATIIGGNEPTVSELEAMRNIGNAAPAIGGALFPYSGGVRTISRLAEGLEGPNATYYNTRFLVTGERPNTALRTDIFDQMLRQGKEMDNRVFRPGPGVQPLRAPDDTVGMTKSLPPFIKGGGAIQ